MKILKNLEIEWKILITGALLFIIFMWPVHTLLISRVTDVLNQSVDDNLELLLREKIDQAKSESEKEKLLRSLTRHKQWKALIPIYIDEQAKSVTYFSITLFLFLLIIAGWALKRLTQPLKNLSIAVAKIGKGTKTEVKAVSGGALGLLEREVQGLSKELDVLREKFHTEGMESAWQEIARVMAHEIKNPLTPIRLTLDRIEEKIVLEEELEPQLLEKAITRINSQLDVLEKLVNQFRSFSKEPEAALIPLNLCEELCAVGESMGRSLQTIVDCEYKVKADPYLLRQILLNIWKNSLEAEATVVEVLCERKEDMVTLHIKDNGVGIKKEDIEKIWLPYVTMKKGGTGLGLPVVKKLVETMNGTVTIESDNNKNKGVIIKITLPYAQEEV